MPALRSARRQLRSSGRPVSSIARAARRDPRGTQATASISNGNRRQASGSAGRPRRQPISQPKDEISSEDELEATPPLEATVKRPARNGTTSIFASTPRYLVSQRHSSDDDDDDDVEEQLQAETSAQGALRNGRTRSSQQQQRPLPSNAVHSRNVATSSRTRSSLAAPITISSDEDDGPRRLRSRPSRDSPEPPTPSSTSTNGRQAKKRSRLAIESSDESESSVEEPGPSRRTTRRQAVADSMSRSPTPRRLTRSNDQSAPRRTALRSHGAGPRSSRANGTEMQTRRQREARSSPQQALRRSRRSQLAVETSDEDEDDAINELPTRARRPVRFRSPTEGSDDAQGQSTSRGTDSQRRPVARRRRRFRRGILDTQDTDDEDLATGSSESEAEAELGRQHLRSARRVERIMDVLGDSSQSSSPSMNSEESDVAHSEAEEEAIADQALGVQSVYSGGLPDFDLPEMDPEESSSYIFMPTTDLAAQSLGLATSSGRKLTKRRRLGLDAMEDVIPEPSWPLPQAPTAPIDDEEPDEIPDANQTPILQRHWERCTRCNERANWHELPALEKIAARIQAKRVKSGAHRQRQKSRARSMSTTLSLADLTLLDGYDEDNSHLHDLDSAEARLEEQMVSLRERGAWLECVTCSASTHTGCMVDARVKEILALLNAEEAARHKALKLPGPPPTPRHNFLPNEFISFLDCEDCYTASWSCMICSKRCIDNTQPTRLTAQNEVVFRCRRCDRTAHHGCIQEISGEDGKEEAALARQAAEWKCFDCESWGSVEAILAWRHQDSAEEDTPSINWRGPLKPADDLKRDYLVKFKDASFRETQWVPHFWLRSVHTQLLRHFLVAGSRLELDPAIDGTGIPSASQPAPVQAPSPQVQESLRRSKRSRLALTASRETGEVTRSLGPPEPDAQQRIPKTWITPDRVLDVYFDVRSLGAESLKSLSRQQLRRLQKTDRPPGITKDDQSAGIFDRKDTFASDANLAHISQLEELYLDGLSDDQLKAMVPSAKVLIKWEDLEYEQATWEDGIDPVSYGEHWPALISAFRRFVASNKIFVRRLSAFQMNTLETQRNKTNFQAIKDQPEYVVGGQMLDFQLEGLNWLRYGWHDRQPGILADEMGLGKTVQVVAFLAALHHEYDGLAPYLVVVPNSVVSNWVREFEKWCPHLRVVPYYGGHQSRSVIERFELFHLDTVEGRQDLRADVVICSDTTARLDTAPLKRVQRWQALVVDEGTSLKGGPGTLLYRRLNELKVAHRIIMTGTPLNNNLTELFHMLGWLKPNAEWSDIKALGKKYEVLTPSLITELQEMLRPYFLRRLKKDVVNLPPRSETLLPVDLTPLQKRVYKDILEKNVADIQALTQARSSTRREQKAHVSNIMNILMQLRKACQHPYLVAPSLERFDLNSDREWKAEAKRLLEASGKLKALQKLLARLKARGRRVLIFSQLVIFLDIIESFLVEEGVYKYLRLDGNVGNRQRQKGITAFNAPDSEYFCYLLSTRAGGVGINLHSANTVIIMDSDFNPHLDMQAIARAHRIGQTEKVIVFTLVAKSTAEEQIVNNARKKLLLDHVVHTINAEEENRVAALQDVVRHGAQALFAEGSSSRTRAAKEMTDADADKLIDDALEAEDAATSTQNGEGSSSALLSFARVWERDDEATDPTAEMADEDFWNSLLEKTQAAAEAQNGAVVDGNGEVVYGRGGYRRAKMLVASQALTQTSNEGPLPAGQVPGQPAPPSGNAADPSMAMNIDTGVDFSEPMDMTTPRIIDAADNTATDADWTMDTSTALTISDSEDGTEDTRDANDLINSATTRRKRGRPPKERPPLRDYPAPFAEADRPPPTPSSSQARSLFDSTRRSLARPRGRPKKTGAGGEPRRLLAGLASSGQNGASSGSSSTLARPTPVDQGPVTPANIYERLAAVTTAPEALALCAATYPDQPNVSANIFKAWQSVMNGRQQGASSESNGAASAPRAQARGPPVAGPSSSAGPTRMATDAPAAIGTSAPANGAAPNNQASAGETAVQQRPRPRPSSSTGRPRGRPPKTVVQNRQSGQPLSHHQINNPAPATSSPWAPSTTSTSQARPSGASSTTVAPASQQRSQPAPPRPSSASNSIVLNRPVGGSSVQPAMPEARGNDRLLEPLRSRQELEALFDELPETFMADVRARTAQGPPKPLVAPEDRSQLTRTHMAYFSLRLLNYPMGIHPLFPDAFMLVRADQVPPNFRALAFEGAEQLSQRTVTERLLDTAHYYYAQLMEVLRRERLQQEQEQLLHQQQLQQQQQEQQRTYPQSQTRDAHRNGSSVWSHQPTVAASSSRSTAAPRSAQRHSNNPWATIAVQSTNNPWAPSTASSSSTQQAQSTPVLPQGAATADAIAADGLALIAPDAQPPEGSGQAERLAFYWLQGVDELNLPGLSKGARMWLLQPVGPVRETVGREINDRLRQVLDNKRRTGQSIPAFFRQTAGEN